MNVLVACEESQAVTIAFRERGHRAFSCDLQECSGGHPEWHVCGDVLPLINGNCTFNTQDGHTHTQNGTWDILIAHPPCTYFAVSGNAWFNEEKYGDKARHRKQLRQEALQFFMEFVNADCPRKAIENPVGTISSFYRKPDQIIQPWMFGDNDSKATCLWLYGLERLEAETTRKPEMEYHEWYDKKTGMKKRQPLWMYESAFSLSTADRQRLRSKTFPGVAKAMAEQWGREKQKPQISFEEVLY